MIGAILVVSLVDKEKVFLSWTLKNKSLDQVTSSGM